MMKTIMLAVAYSIWIIGYSIIGSMNEPVFEPYQCTTDWECEFLYGEAV